MSGKPRRRQLARLFKEQNGLCHWCKKPMRKPGSFDGSQGIRFPDDICTMDHLVERFNGRKKGDKCETVAACFRCNHERGNRARDQWLQELKSA